MALNGCIVVCYLLLQIEAIHSHSHSIINASANPFDGGPLSYCQKPPIEQGSVCSDVVHYNVPTSVAKLTKIIEALIKDNLEEEISEPCGDIYRKALCLHRFPRCQLNTMNNVFQVIINEQAYFAALSENCGKYAIRFRGIEKTFRVDGSCRPISELTKEFSFKSCPENSNDLVTPWMLEYIKGVDLIISYRSGVLFTYKVCGEKFTSFRCNFIGRCTSEGHVQFINSYESCMDAANCYASQLQPFAEYYSHCEQWPHIPGSSSHRQAAAQRAGKVGGIVSSQKTIHSELSHFSVVATVLLGIAMFHYAI